MASTQLYLIFAIILVVLPAITLAKEFIVGDDKGWTIGFDYQAWAEGKDFQVGDKLVFTYPEGRHNVIKVNATDFQKCIAPPEAEALTTGNDIITLATSGKKWYLCGVGQHCASGQRLSINVKENLVAPTSPTTGVDNASSANKIATYGYQALAAASVAVLMMFLA